MPPWTRRRWKTGWQRLAATNDAIVPRKRTPSDIRDQIIDLFLRADSSFSAPVLHGVPPPPPRVSTTVLLLLLLAAAAAAAAAAPEDPGQKR
ncbi:hypothetical protein HL42_4641 [Trichophyton rubrum]|nr:hypothetical protein HL42_4641 [Trichophyton rubrum]